MGRKILIVDDEPNVAYWLSYALQTEGYEVETAETGREGLNKILTAPPDLVILDVMLPDLSGTEVCEQIRANPGTISLPIIMLSGRTQVPDKVKGLKSGADEYITKPVETEEMLARVEALLNRTIRLSKTQSASHGKVLGFLGVKGGVGTTTVALNVALALVKNQKKVIAAELRPYLGTFAPQLGLSPNRTLADLLNLESEEIDAHQLSRRLITHSSGLQVLLGPPNMAMCQEIQPNQAEAIVVGLSGMADYTIIDLAWHPSMMNQAIMKCCDSLVIVLEPDPACIALGQQTVQLMQEWGIGTEKTCATIVQRGEATSQALSDIASQVGCEIAGTMTRASELSLLALRQGSPLVLSHPESLAAGTLTELANRLGAEQSMAFVR
ncbi:MAG: response regulator [Nitrospirota bacterium]|nr:response regulator [Nitrospirota bacterium]MDH5297105.1 response regulator [Nitrospirota bacterium]MDH5575904.1 response regulator [Nitrospirota bacterium]